MLYRNTLTGAVIDTACAIHGDNWETYTPIAAATPPEKTTEPDATAKDNAREKTDKKA